MTTRLHCGDRVEYSHRGTPKGTVATYRIVHGVQLVSVRLDDAPSSCDCGICGPGQLLHQLPAARFHPIASSPSPASSKAT